MPEMTCPDCGGEYREEIVVCADCGGPLVPFAPGPPAEIPSLELVTVLATGSIPLLTLAESLLQEAEIPFLKKGDRLQELEGGGRIGSGYNLIFGPVEIQVPSERAEEALEILSGLEENPPELTEEP